MTDRRPPRYPAHGKLTPEDMALWRHVTDGVEPLHGKRVAEVSHPTSAEPPGPAATSKNGHAPGGLRSVQKNGARAVPPPLSPIDKRTHQRLARGRIELDGRIDLHGMRQDEAHRHLIAYLKAIRGKGGRTVLVITGKGRPDTGDGPWWESRETGVLRRIVPQWLSQPTLRDVVQGFDWAAGPHGGGGALYVRLRRRKSR